MNSKDIYEKRVNRAIDYITENLGSNMDINAISRVAGFSTYHFHRIFRAFVGEPLYGYVNRLRVEKVATLLLTTDINITEATFLVGFQDSATFARALKKRFNVSASKWKKNSKNHQELSFNKQYYLPVTIEPSSVTIVTEPTSSFLYVRSFGKYICDSKIFMTKHKELIKKLNDEPIIWRKDLGFYAIYQDAVGITELDKLRLTYGVIAESEVSSYGNLEVLQFEETTFLKAKFQLAEEEYGLAWTSLYREVVPQYGVIPVDGLCYENYKERCYNSISGKTDVVLGIAVKMIKES